MFLDKIKKVFFDKEKEVKYNWGNGYTLVRKMFPWINRIDDKKTLSKLLADTDPDIKKLLSTFYRSEVNELIAQKKYSEIVQYEWILKLISELTYLTTNPNEYVWERNEWWE